LPKKDRGPSEQDILKRRIKKILRVPQKKAVGEAVKSEPHPFGRARDVTGMVDLEQVQAE
jgi:hypothetical protein